MITVNHYLADILPSEAKIGRVHNKDAVKNCAKLTITGKRKCRIVVHVMENSTPSFKQTQLTLAYYCAFVYNR